MMRDSEEKGLDMDDGKRSSVAAEEAAKIRKGRMVAEKLRDIALAALAACLYLMPFTAWESGGIGVWNAELCFMVLAGICILVSICTPYATGEKKAGESYVAGAKGAEDAGSGLECACDAFRLMSIGGVAAIVTCRWIFGISWEVLLYEWTTALFLVVTAAWLVSSIACGMRVKGGRGSAADLQGGPNWAAAVVAVLAVVLLIAVFYLPTTAGAVIERELGSNEYEIAAIEKMAADKDPVTYDLAGSASASELADELADERLSNKQHETGASMADGAVYTLTVFNPDDDVLTVTIGSGKLHVNGPEVTYDLTDDSVLYQLCKEAFKEAKAEAGE